MATLEKGKVFLSKKV